MHTHIYIQLNRFKKVPFLLLDHLHQDYQGHLLVPGQKEKCIFVVIREKFWDKIL